MCVSEPVYICEMALHYLKNNGDDDDNSAI